MHLTNLLIKWVTAAFVLLLFGLAYGPSPTQALVIAAIVAVAGWTGDRLLPFRHQGVTRWAIDSGLTALAVWFGQFFWPGTGIGFGQAVIAGFVIGAVEIPLHVWLASRFGLRRRQDNNDGIG